MPPKLDWIGVNWSDWAIHLATILPIPCGFFSNPRPKKHNRLWCDRSVIESEMSKRGISVSTRSTRRTTCQMGLFKTCFSSCPWGKLGCGLAALESFCSFAANSSFVEASHTVPFVAQPGFCKGRFRSCSCRNNHPPLRPVWDRLVCMRYDCSALESADSPG
jgi:hypothetical protein